MASVEKPDGGNSRAVREPQGKKSKDGTPVRLLVVEDSVVDLELAVTELRRGGIDPTVHRVETKEEFLSGLENFAPDVILLDFQLPRFGPKLAIILARERLPGVPLIVVSGIIGEERAVELLKLGASDFVPKDRLDYLPAAVRRALDERAEHQERLRNQEHAQKLATELKSCMAERTREREETNEQIARLTGTARALHLSLLPWEPPPVPPGASRAGKIQLAARCAAADPASGHFFEWLRFGERELGLFSCQPSDRVMHPVFRTLLLRSIMFGGARSGGDPGAMLSEIDRRVVEIARRSGFSIGGRALLLVADTGTREVRFASAGHPLPRRLRGGKGAPETIGSSEQAGPALGVEGAGRYVTSRAVAGDGDRFLILNEGMEALGREGERNAGFALAGVFQEKTDGDLERLLDHILKLALDTEGKPLPREDLCAIGVAFE